MIVFWLKVKQSWWCEYGMYAWFDRCHLFQRLFCRNNVLLSDWTLWSCNVEFFDFRWVCQAEKNKWTVEAMLAENVFFCRYGQCLLAAKRVAEISNISVVLYSPHIHLSFPFHSHLAVVGFFLCFFLIITKLFYYFYGFILYYWANSSRCWPYCGKFVSKDTKSLCPSRSIFLCSDRIFKEIVCFECI